MKVMCALLYLSSLYPALKAAKKTVAQAISEI
jgi:ABC-type lipoprotein release transport system permease subunit